MIISVSHSPSNSGHIGIVVADSFKEAAAKLGLKIEEEISPNGTPSYCNLEQGFQLVRMRDSEITSFESLLSAMEKAKKMKKKD